MSRWVNASTLIFSAVLHGGLVVSGAWLLSRHLHDEGGASPISEIAVGVERQLQLPVSTTLGQDVLAQRDVATQRERVPRPGRPLLVQPDMGQQGGRGVGAQASVNLASHLDDVTSVTEPWTGDAYNQVQRLRTATERRSWEDRRSTPNPMQLTFIVSGSAERPERRVIAVVDPSTGLLDGARPMTQGGRAGTLSAENESGVKLGREGARDSGTAQRIDPAGVARGRGISPVRRARVALARPSLKKGLAAVPTRERARPKDTVDSSLAVAQTVESLMLASRGVSRGAQSDGVGTGAGNGAGRSAPGSVSSAREFGAGGDSGTSLDRCASVYGAQVRAHIEPYWREALPEWAIAQGRGATASVSFVVSSRGSVERLALLRPSGIAEYDANLIHALRRAAPLPSPPSSGPCAALFPTGQARLTLHFDSLNPAVGLPHAR